ncbi:hypothetical protein ACQKP7_11485 [Pseudomonas frederiksbergensis]|uniref:hypothetical protein n=1 Tax=Pseudomonas frederiksbergensis TaxID=104087 RepID=UPI003D00FA49
MSLENNNDAFMANLYVDGLPLVLNQQRLKRRLQDPRITRRERLDVEVALADRDGTSFVTLADHEDDKPLLFKFALQGDKYAVTAVLRGMYDGWRLKIEANTHHLSVSDSAASSLFSISKHGAPRARLEHLGAGPSYIQLVSERNGRALYKAEEAGRKYFMDVDPNTTVHNAFNNTPVAFVLKIVDKLVPAAK